MISTSDLRNFHRALHGWFLKNGRDLPWRRNRDPYAVLVSEFMLQQTTVTAVIPFYERWMTTFPDLASLAAADEQKVLKLWEGLGYYSRARNLRRAAQMIVSNYGGVVPDQLTDLLRLPGIGPYTAAAILAFAFDRPVPVLDANIVRVVARLFDYRKPVTASRGKDRLQQAARSLLPRTGGYLHASALMELGALICKSGKPDCGVCPAKRFCAAKKPESIPVKPARKRMIEEHERRGVALAKGRIHLALSAGPRWKGLWVLPTVLREGNLLMTFSCVVTRHKITTELVRAKARPEWKAFDTRNLPPMPSPHRRAVLRLLPDR